MHPFKYFGIVFKKVTVPHSEEMGYGADKQGRRVTTAL